MANASNGAGPVIRRVLVGIGIALFVVLAVVLVVAWSAGWSANVVKTESMDPAVPRGSLAVVVPVDADDLRVGDVIAFHPPTRSDRTVLHRITSVNQINNALVIRTKGDANEEPDPAPITPSAVEGRMRWHVPGAGNLANLLLPPLGPILLVGLPALFLVGMEVSRARRMRRNRDLVDPASSDGMSIAAMLASGTLTPGDRLVPVDPSIRSVAEITSDGRIELEGTNYESFEAAATADGWSDPDADGVDYWAVLRGQSAIALRSLVSTAGTDPVETSTR